MKYNKSISIAAAITLLFAACTKDDTKPVHVAVTTGVYVLSEGLFNGNNTTLTYYDFAGSKATTDFYAAVNGSGLGDTGNDLVIYGSKAYIVMNVSSYVQVINAATGLSNKKIDFKAANGSSKQPRYALGYAGKIYVSSYDGTVSVIDTTTLSIEKTINVGGNPERLTQANGFIYVANSGFGTDSTVSVIDAATKTELKKITVGLNPFDLAATSTGDVYVTTRSVYGNDTYIPQIHIIDSKTNTVKTTLPAAISQSNIRIYNDTAYLFGSYISTDGVCSLYNTKTNALIKSSFVTDGTVVTNTYGININPDNGDVYVTDSKDYTSPGEVFCFDRTGKKKFSFSVTPGINPNTVAFIKQ